MKNVFYLILAVLFCVQTAQAAGAGDYGAAGKNNVRMEYSFQGGYSPYKYARVSIIGDGKTIWSYQYVGGTEQSGNLRLSPQLVDTLIAKFKKSDFLKFDYKDVTLGNNEVVDAGNRTIEFKYKENTRKISFSAVKTYCPENSACRPINKTAQLLQDIQNIFGKVISQQDYLFQLKDYRSLTPGQLANLLSSLEADARDGHLLNTKEYVPVVMGIISDDKLRESIGQYAAPALERLTGKNPKGDWWDCQRWLVWWEKNKDDYKE